MYKIFKYSPIIIGGIIGLIMAIYDIPLSIDNIVSIFLLASVFFFIVYTFFILYIRYKIKLFLSNKAINLDKLETIISNFPSNQLKCYFIIDLSVGYSIKKDFQKALELLDRLDINKQNKKTKVLYYNNKAYFLYKLGKKEEAKEIIEKNKELFDRYLTDVTIASILQDTIEKINNDK